MEKLKYAIVILLKRPNLFNFLNYIIKEKRSYRKVLKFLTLVLNSKELNILKCLKVGRLYLIA